MRKFRKFIACLLVRIAFRVCPESKAVKKFAQYLATSAMIDGGYVKIVKPEELYKETQHGNTGKTQKSTVIEYTDDPVKGTSDTEESI